MNMQYSTSGSTADTSAAAAATTTSSYIVDADFYYTYQCKGAVALNNMGVTLLKRKKYKDAVVTFQHALRLIHSIIAMSCCEDDNVDVDCTSISSISSDRFRSIQETDDIIKRVSQNLAAHSFLDTTTTMTNSNNTQKVVVISDTSTPETLSAFITLMDPTKQYGDDILAAIHIDSCDSSIPLSANNSLAMELNSIIILHNLAISTNCFGKEMFDQGTVVQQPLSITGDCQEKCFSSLTTSTFLIEKGSLAQQNSLKFVKKEHAGLSHFRHYFYCNSENDNENDEYEEEERRCTTTAEEDLCEHETSHVPVLVDEFEATPTRESSEEYHHDAVIDESRVMESEIAGRYSLLMILTLQTLLIISKECDPDWYNTCHDQIRASMGIALNNFSQNPLYFEVMLIAASAA